MASERNSCKSGANRRGWWPHLRSPKTEGYRAQEKLEEPRIVDGMGGLAALALSVDPGEWCSRGSTRSAQSTSGRTSRRPYDNQVCGGDTNPGRTVPKRSCGSCGQKLQQQRRNADCVSGSIAISFRRELPTA